MTSQKLGPSRYCAVEHEVRMPVLLKANDAEGGISRYKTPTPSRPQRLYTYRNQQVFPAACCSETHPSIMPILDREQIQQEAEWQPQVQKWAQPSHPSI